MSFRLPARIQGDDRAVSPVIGVVLMVGIFAILMAVIGAFVLGFSPTQPPPDAEMAYIEEGAAGVGVQVVMGIGDEFEADNVQFQLEDGTVCEGWGSEGSVGTGDQTLLAYCGGDGLSEGDRIHAIWSDSTGTQSAIIGTHEVLGDVDMATEQCSDLDLSGDSVTIKEDQTVSCDIPPEGDRGEYDVIIKDGGTLVGNVYLEDDYELEFDGTGTIVGDVDLDGDEDVELEDGDEITGDVRSGGDVDVTDSDIGGNVDSGGDVELEEGSSIGGDVDSDGDVELEEGSSIGGDVDSADGVELEDGSEIDGNVDSGGDVELDDASEIDGDVTTTDDGDVEIDSGSVINGNVDAAGDIQFDEQSEVYGDVRTDASLDMGDSTDGATIYGTVIVEGDVDLDDDSRIVGDLRSYDSVDIEDSVIEGRVLAEGDIDIEDSVIEESVLAEGDIDIESDAVVQGDAISQEDIDDKGTVEGTVKKDVDKIADYL